MTTGRIDLAVVSRDQIVVLHAVATSDDPRRESIAFGSEIRPLVLRDYLFAGGGPPRRHPGPMPVGRIRAPTRSRAVRADVDNRPFPLSVSFFRRGP